MEMSIQMQLRCERCGLSRVEMVPARFHYSDGCYTVLAIENQECPEETCQEQAKAEQEAARRARTARAVKKALSDKHSPDCQGTCCGGLP